MDRCSSIYGLKAAIMQPYLFPYIGYFQLLNAVDIFVIYNDVNYIKRGWINRNRILVNGKPFLFTMPLKKASQNRLISQTEISDSFTSWRIKFMEQLRHAYHRAPFYSDCICLVKEVLCQDEYRLDRFLGLQIEIVAEYLGIGTQIVYSSEVGKGGALKGQDRIIDICRKTGAQVYINPLGGKELYDQSDFFENGLDLLFLECQTVEYRQLNHPFVSNLSIIDVLMFNSVERVREFLNRYELYGERACRLCQT